MSRCSRKSPNGTATRTADAVGQVGELLGVVQHLHTLGVGVVAHRERLGDGRCKFPVEQADGNWGKNKETAALSAASNQSYVRAYLTFSLAFSKLSATK